MEDIDKKTELIIDEFKKNILIYSDEDRKKIEKAFVLADSLHEGQKRKSGEKYIIHPVSVANILIGFKADSDTICAGLLHDTVEDTDITKEELVNIFNPTVAELVDGVTKLRRMDFVSKREQNLANSRKIITSIKQDVRIIIIKLADRLHNMQTLEFHKPEKQKEIAIETMELFVPLANYIGSYRLKSELEDLSLKYLKPDKYEECKEIRLRQEEELLPGGIFEEISKNISSKLRDEQMWHYIIPRIKNIYGIYTRLNKGITIPKMHDLLSCRVIVKSVGDCYSTLGYVHNLYKSHDSYFHDYISNPKINLYQAIHTVLFIPCRLFLVRIMTDEMMNIANHGITANWDLNSELARQKMQTFFEKSCRDVNALYELDNVYSNNIDFITHIRSEIFTDKIYVYTPRGEIIELPVGATPVDFAYKVGREVGDYMQDVIINGEEHVPLDYKLQTGQCINIVVNSSHLCECSEDVALTTQAKSRILQRNKYNH